MSGHYIGVSNLLIGFILVETFCFFGLVCSQEFCISVPVFYSHKSRCVWNWKEKVATLWAELEYFFFRIETIPISITRRAELEYDVCNPNLAIILTLLAIQVNGVTKVTISSIPHDGRYNLLVLGWTKLLPAINNDWWMAKSRSVVSVSAIYTGMGNVFSLDTHI